MNATVTGLIVIQVNVNDEEDYNYFDRANIDYRFCISTISGRLQINW